MKRFWSIALVVAMVIGLTCGCAKKETNEPAPTTPKTQTETKKSTTYYKTPERFYEVDSLVRENLGNGTRVETKFNNETNAYIVAVQFEGTYVDVVAYGIDGQYNELTAQIQDILGCDVVFGLVDAYGNIIFASMNGADRTAEFRS